MKKILSTILSVLLIVTLFAGCSDSKTVDKYDAEAEIKTLSTQTVVSNDFLSLSWNNEGKFVALEEKETKKIWSTVPYEYFKSGGTSDNINSPINITVANAAKAQWDTISGYAESVSKDRASVERIDTGLKITYYFDNYLISVPVKYELFEDNFKISVDSSEIVEGGEKKLLSVSLSPFLCSAQNTSEDSYLFVPSGNGGLMYVDERAEGTRKYTAEVFGTDSSRLVPEEAVDDVKVYLPVYGIKDKDSALLAIIDKGAEQAEIYAEAGNRRTEYSTIYTTFYLRGYDVVETDQWLWGYRDLSRISDNKINTELSISYYPLSGKDADYNGMSRKYKEYLFADGKAYTSAADYSLKILGGVTYKSASGGIPHKELYTMTSFKEAENILTHLTDISDSAPIVTMQGFSDTGIDVGKIAGGFDFSGDYGNEDDLNSLKKKCSDIGADLSFDFDLVRFNSSSNGFSYMMDSAKSATLRTVDKYGINIPLRSYNSEEYRLLKRSQIDTAVEKLIDFTKDEKLTSIGISTLSSIAYSDFDEEKYSFKGNMSYQVRESIKNFKKNGIKVYASDANSYAAEESDILLDVPGSNGDYFALDEEVPFYQMVFCGIKPMYCDAINLADISQKAVMKAVSTGVRFSFTVTGNYDTVYASNKSERLYGTKFSSVKAGITDLLTKYSDFYDSISGVSIESYELLKNGITKTEFSNGITVYANHLNSNVETTVGDFEPYGVKIIK